MRQAERRCDGPVPATLVLVPPTQGRLRMSQEVVGVTNVKSALRQLMSERVAPHFR